MPEEHDAPHTHFVIFDRVLRFVRRWVPGGPNDRNEFTRAAAQSKEVRPHRIYKMNNVFL